MSVPVFSLGLISRYRGNVPVSKLSRMLVR